MEKETSIDEVVSPYRSGTISVIEVREENPMPKPMTGKSSLNAVDVPTRTLPCNGKVSNIPEREKQSARARAFASFCSNITVEPFIFLFTLAVAMCLSPAIFHQLLTAKVCLTTLSYPKSLCDALGDRSTLVNGTVLKQVTTTSSAYIWCSTLLSTLPSALTVLLVGPWTDSNSSRKLPMVLACFGSWLAMIQLILNTHFMTGLNTNYLMIASASFGVLGGCTGASLGAITYLADVTSIERRTVRIGFMQGSMLCGGFLGLFLGAIIQKVSGPIAVFLLGALSSIVCILYATCALGHVEKSEGNVKKTESKGFCRQLCSVLSVRRILEAMGTCFRKRENNHRMHIFFLMIILLSYSFPLFGEVHAATKYITLKFEWSETTFKYYQLAIGGFSILGFFVALPLLVRLHMSDAMISVIGTCTKVISDLVCVISPESWALFAAAPTVIFSALNVSVVHSMISKRVEPNEQGKIMSVAAAIEVSTPILGLVVYNNLAEITKDIFPGSFYIVSVCLFLISAVLITVIWWDERKQESNAVVAHTSSSYSANHQMNNLAGRPIPEN